MHKFGRFWARRAEGGRAQLAVSDLADEHASCPLFRHVRTTWCDARPDHGLRTALGTKTTLEAGIGVWARGRSSRSGLFGSLSTAVTSRCCAHRLVSLGDVGWLVRPRNHSRSVPVDSTVRPESVQGSRQWRSRPVAC